MAALRSGAPSRLRQLLAAEGSAGSPLKLDTEAPPEVKNFIDMVIRSPLQDIAIPLSGFRWEYNKCNVHHWEALFRHFDAYFKAYVSCRKDLLLLDITSDNSGSFPKHAVLQILRVTQVILENCQGKSSFSGLEHFKVLLSSTDPEIVIATLETLSVLVKINPSKLNVSGNLISCGSLNSHLLSLAQGWGSKEEGLGLYTCVVANEKSQEEHFSLFPPDLQDSSGKSQLRLGSTLHFEFYTENVKDRASNSSKLQIIHIPDAHLQGADDLTLVNQLFYEFDVPQERRFCLLTRIRYACSFRSPKTFRLYSRISLLAFIVLVQSNDAKDELVSFFANEPEYNKELIQLVQTEETIPGTVRTLAMLALGAQIAACASSHERAQILTEPGIISVSGNQIVLSNVLQRAMHLLNENSSDLSSLSFVEALLQFHLLHVISSIRADSAFSGSGMIPTLLPLLQDANSTHMGLVCAAIKTLQKLMDYSNDAVSLFKHLGGIELLTHRLKTEVDRINCGDNDLMLIGDFSKTGNTLYAHRRVVKSLLKTLGSAAYSPANLENATTTTDNCLIYLLSAIFCNANKFGGGIYLSAVNIMSDIIHKDPTCFSVLHEMGLFDAFLSSIKAGILPSSKVLRCIPSGLGAICLNAKGLSAVKETAALRFMVDAFTSKKYMVAMNEGVSSLANSLEELLRHVSSLRSLGVDIIIEIVGKLALMGEITSRESSMNVDGDCTTVTSSCDSLFVSGDPTLGGISNEHFFLLCIFHLLVLLHRMMDNSETCRVFVEKKGIEALMKLLLQISVVQSSEGMSIAIYGNLVFRNFAQHCSGQLAQTFCSSLHEHLKNALTGITSVGSSFLLTPGSIPDNGTFSSLFIVEFLLFIAAARDARWVTALVSEFGGGSQDVLITLGRVHREILWQISLLDDAEVETRNNGSSTSGVSRRLETSAANESEDHRGNSFWQFVDPLMRRRSLSLNAESQLLDLTNLYRDLGHGSGFHQRMGFEGASRLTAASSLCTSSEDGEASSKAENDQHRSHYSSCCDMLRTLSFHISSLFLELGKVSLLPPRRRDELFNLSPSTRAVVFTISSIVLDHLNFVGVADPSNSEGVISTKCRFLGKIVGFVDSILSERQDSCNPILINCFYGHEVVQTVLTTFKATSQLLFAVSRGPASADTEGRGLTRSEENENNKSWIYGPLASYGKLLDHLVTSSFIISPSTKHLLAQPLFTANIPYPRDPEAFVRGLQSKVLKAVLPIWTHPQFNECSCDFITVILSIMRHIYTGVDMKNVNVSSGAQLPSLPVDESAISLIVEMGFSRSRAEEALRQVGSNSVELAMEWLFSHPEETQEDDELTRALAMSLGSSELSMKGASAAVPDNIEQEDEVVQLPSVGEMLSTFTKLLQLEKPLAFPVRDFLLLICSQNNGNCCTKVVMFILDHLQLSGGNHVLLSALFLVLALLLHEDRAAREVAHKGGLVRIALEVLSQWDTGSCKGEVPKWVTTALLAIDRMLLVDPNQGSEISSAEQLEKDNNAKQTPLVPDKKSDSLQSLLALNPGCVDLSQQKWLIEILCRCIQRQLPSEAMHVVLQLCATLTKVHSVAITFLEEGGFHSLLSLPTSCLVGGLDNIAATIVRHILEDPLTLQQAMETEIRHSMLGATNAHSNRRITPRLFLQNLSTVVLRDPEIFMLAAKSLCQVEMVGERPHIVLCQGYEKEKKGSKNDKDKLSGAVDKNVSGKQFDSHAKGEQAHRKPPHSFVSVIEYLLDMIMTFTPPQNDSSSISGSSPTLPLADVEIDGTTSSKAKGKAVASVSEEKTSGFQDASATLAKTVFVLKLLTEIVLTYASSIYILLRKDTEISSGCGSIQCNYSVNGGGRNGIFHHVIHKFLAYPISYNKGGSEKLEGDWRHKLASRTRQLLVASSISSADSRRRILFEINNVFSELVESTDGCMVPRCNLNAYIDLLNDILAGRTPTGSCVSAEASSTFIDVGLVHSLTNILKILDLDRSDSAKIATGIVKALESVTREHICVANNSSSKEQSCLNRNSDENQSTRTDNADGRNRLQVMETVPQPDQAEVVPVPIQASGSSPSSSSEMVHDQLLDGNEDDSIHEIPEVHGGLENGSIGISIDVAHDSPANSDADDGEEMAGEEGDEDNEHNNMDENVIHHMAHPDTNQDDHEIDGDDFDNDLLEIENEDDEDDENGVILRLEESINGIDVHDQIEALGRDYSLSNETFGVIPLEVFGSRQRGRTTSIYNLLERSGDRGIPLQHPLLVDPSSSRPVIRRQSDTAIGGLPARGLLLHGHQFNMWPYESQPHSNGPSGAVIPHGFEEILVSQLRQPSKQQAFDQNTRPQQQDNGDTNQIQKVVESSVEITSEDNVNNENINIVLYDEDSERTGTDATVPSENDLQLEHVDAEVLGVQMLRQESGGSGVTLGESLHSLEVEIRNGAGHDDRGERQGLPERLRMVTPSHGAAILATGQDASLLQNDREALPLSSPEQNQNMDTGSGLEHPREVGAGSIDPAFFESPERLTTVTPSHGAATPATEQDATLLQNDQEALPLSDLEENQNMDSFAGVEQPREVEAGSIDPAFLEALPEELRAEVLSGQQNQVTQPSSEQTLGAGEIDPEFLAALPPDIRDEVLAQQQAQRRNLSQELEGQPVDMDTVSIIATFPSDLREEVLLTSSDAILANLTPALFAEANMLRERFAHRNSRNFLGFHPRNRRGESSRQVDGVGSNGERATGSIGSCRIGGKIIEADGAPLVDQEALKAIIRLFQVVKPLYKGQLQRLLLNLCVHSETRSALVQILMGMLMLDIQGPLKDIDVFQEPPYRLYACQSHVTYSQPKYSNGVPPLVSRRILETLTYLARNHPYVAKLMLHQELPRLHAHTSKISDQTSGKAVMIIEEGKNNDKDYAVVLLLGLLNLPLYLRSTAHLEQLLGLLDAVIDNAGDNSRQSKKSFSSKEPSASQSSTQLASEASKPAIEPSVSAVNSKTVTSSILCSLPDLELRLLCSLLARDGLSDNAYTLVSKVLNKLVDIAPIYCHFFLAEFAESVQTLMQSAMDELQTYEKVEKVAITSASTSGTAILRVLQAFIFLISLLHEKVKNHLLLSKKDYSAVSQVLEINSTLEPLWMELSSCISKIESSSRSVLEMSSTSAVASGLRNISVSPLPRRTLDILPYIEAFFLVCEKLHPGESGCGHDNIVGVNVQVEDTNTSCSVHKTSCLQAKVDEKEVGLVKFLEKHRKLLNAFIRQNPGLLEKSFSVLLQLPRFIDFDNKRAHFKSKIKHKHDHHHSSLRISVRRAYMLEDSYNQLRLRSTQELKGKLTVNFQGEEGIDAGGLTREWYQLLSRVIFDKGTLLFTTVGNDSTFQPNPNSSYQTEHLSYFKFVGRVVAKALFDGQLLDVHFTRSFYKHILGVKVTYHDIEAIEPAYFKNLKWVLEHDISNVLDMTFTLDADEEKLILYEKTEVTDFELIPGGRNIKVTEENKHQYVDLRAEHRLTTAIRPQINAFLEGFNELIPRELISIFNNRELELLISGLPEIDLDDLQANTEYSGYTAASPVVQWLWEVVQGFSKEDKARLLQFVTGTSKVPLEGFSALQGIAGSQRFQIHKAYGSANHLPSAHTCFNQLDLPEYPSKEQLQERLLMAIHEGGEGFGFG